MSLHKYVERIKVIDYLVRTKSTGNITALSKKLHLSKVGTYKFLNELKEEGFSIAYSKKEKCYYYTEKGKMVSSLYEKEMDKAEMKKITGGKNILSKPSEYNYS